jgi:flagellar hook-length control protein FliK
MNATSTAGVGVGVGAHKAARQVAEGAIDSAEADAADTPNDSPSFAKMLRDQTSVDQISVAQASDTRQAAACPAKADTPSEAADIPKAMPQTSEQLTAWLAALIKGQTPGAGSAQTAQTARTAPSGTERFSRLAAQTSPSSAAITAHGDTRKAPIEDAEASADKNAGADEKTIRPEHMAAAPEALTAAAEASIAAVPAQTSTSGHKQVLATNAASPEASQDVKSSAQRTGAADLSALPAPMTGLTPSASRGYAKIAPAKGAVASADKNARTDEKPTRPGPMTAAREALTAAAEASSAAVPAQTSASGHKQVLATNAASPEASQAVKASAQRPGAADLSALPAAMTGLTPSASIAHASGAPASATSVLETAVSQDIRRPEFVPVFSARIATLVQEGVEQARVHLNPVEMGPVSLQLSMDGLQVRVDMTAEVAATRLVLEQALPTLAGALREAGFTLSGGGVSPPAEAAHTSGQDTRGAGGSQGEPNPQSSGQSTGLSGQQADGRRPPEAQAGRTLFTGTSGTADGLSAELQLDAEGRPRLPQGRGLVDTFA